MDTKKLGVASLVLSGVGLLASIGSAIVGPKLEKQIISDEVTRTVAETLKNTPKKD